MIRQGELDRLMQCIKNEQLSLAAIGIMSKIVVLQIDPIEDDRNDSIGLTGLRHLTIDECLQHIFDCYFTSFGHEFSQEFGVAIEELERLGFLKKESILVLGEDVSHTYSFVEAAK